MTPGAVNILVLAPNWLGDAVMALPAIADVRRAFTAGRLIVAARAGIADLFTLVPGVDEIVELRWRGTWWRRAEFRADAARLAALGSDAALLLPNSFATASLVRQAGVTERWGYATDWRSRLLTRAIARPRHSVHQGAYYQHLTTALDIPAGPLQPSLVVPRDAVATARRLIADRGWDQIRPLVVLAPGAAYGTAKRWIPAHVATLTRDLIRSHGVTCVFVGSRADRATTQAIAGRLPQDVRPQAIDVAGETTLQTLAGVFSVAQACVSNDSGAMHVAAAIGTPVVALFGPTREYETAPLTAPNGRAEVLTHQVWCRPCMLRECPIDHRCMRRITPERVRVSLERLMPGAAH